MIQHKLAMLRNRADSLGLSALSDADLLTFLDGADSDLMSAIGHVEAEAKARAAQSAQLLPRTPGIKKHRFITGR